MKDKPIVAENGDDLLTRKDVAKRWKRHEETVSNAHKKGLKVIRFGQTNIRYRLSDVIAYELQCLCQ